MTTQPTYTVPPMPNHAPKKAKRKWLVPLLMLAALLVGLTVGAAKPAPDPVTIEKVVEKKVEVPVEKQVEVPVTPTACGDFIDLAEKVNNISSEVLGIMSSTITAAGNLDAATITANNAKLPPQTAKLKAITPDYQSARDTCRASLK